MVNRKKEAIAEHYKNRSPAAEKANESIRDKLATGEYEYLGGGLIKRKEMKDG